MKPTLGAFGSAFAAVAALTLLPIALAVLGGLSLTAAGVGFTFWRARRRRRAIAPPGR